MNKTVLKFIAVSAVLTVSALSPKLLCREALSEEFAEGLTEEFAENGTPARMGADRGPYHMGEGNKFSSRARVKRGPDGGPGGNIQEGAPGGGREKLAAVLGLSDEQQEKIKAQRESHMKMMKDTADLMKIKKLELKYALERDTVNTGTVASLVEEIKSLMGKQLELRVTGTLAMKEILTSEQYDRFQGFARRRRGRNENTGKMRQEPSQAGGNQKRGF